MKNTYYTFVLILLSLLLSPKQVFSQLYEVSLDSRIDQSTLIVEGKVVESKCYRSDDGTIYTANKIEVVGILKGEYRNSDLTITTWGGELDSELQTWTHLLTLNKGEHGIFFLEPTHVPAIKDEDYPESFDVYAASQGFVQFVQNDAKAWIAYDPFHTYSDIPNDLYNYVERKSGQTFTYLNKEKDEKRSGVRYHFTNIDFDGTSVTFHVYANSLIGAKKLYKSGIQIGYNPAFFGSNIATNGNLYLENAGISLSSTYGLTKSNVTSSKVKIELSPVGSLTGLTEIGTSEQLLAKGKITIQNIFADPGITYDLVEMQSMSKFYESGAAQIFDTVIIEGDWTKLLSELAPQILNFTPDTTIVGINDQVSITGTGFGNITLPPVDRKVVFTRVTQPNSPVWHQWMSPLPGDYLQWNDSTIVVNVPSIGTTTGTSPVPDYHAGTGKIGIITPLGTDTVFAKKLYVRGTAFNSAAPNQLGVIGSIRYKFLNRNSDGGYDLYFTSSFTNLNSGQTIDAFKRALVTWRCATGINFRVKPINEIPTSLQQYACRISLGSMPVGVLSSATAITIDSFDICTNSSGIVRFFQVRKFNMIFNDQYNWHTGTDTPTLNWSNTIDLETTALHELGHAHELGHSNNPHNVMWYLVNQYRRNLTTDEVRVGQDIVFYSAVDTSFKCSSPMASVLGVDCSTLPIQEIEKKTILVKAIPNPVLDFVNVVLPEQVIGEKINIRVIDQVGRIYTETNGDITGNVLEMYLGDYSNGIYFLLIEIENENPLITKIIKQ